MNLKRFSFVFVVILFVSFISCKKEEHKTDIDKEKPKTEQTTKVNIDEAIAKISKFRADTETKLEKLTKKEIKLDAKDLKEDIRQKWEKMDAYSDGDKLIRIQIYPHKGISERTEEFYYIDGKLVFVSIKDKGLEVKEGKDEGIGKEFFFDNDKLIKYENKSGETSKNPEEEKKMYETKLVFEAKEFFDLAKTTK